MLNKKSFFCNPNAITAIIFKTRFVYIINITGNYHTFFMHFLHIDSMTYCKQTSALQTECRWICFICESSGAFHNPFLV